MTGISILLYDVLSVRGVLEQNTHVRMLWGESITETCSRCSIRCLKRVKGVPDICRVDVRVLQQYVTVAEDTPLEAHE